MTDPIAAARRIRAFLDAWDERHTTRDHVLVQVKPGSPDMLTSDDLRAVLTERDQLAEKLAVATRTVVELAAQRDVWHGRVLGLLRERRSPLTDESCGHITTERGRQAVLDYRAIRTEQHPKAAHDA